MRGALIASAALLATAGVTGGHATAQPITAAHTAPPPPPLDGCAPYVGRIFTPVTAADVISAIRAVGLRDEFETSAAYTERRDRALARFRRPFVIASEERYRPSYDADRGVIAGWSLAIALNEVDWSWASGLLRPGRTRHVTGAYNYDVYHFAFNLNQPSAPHVLIDEATSMPIGGGGISAFHSSSAPDVPMPADDARVLLDNVRYGFAMTLAEPHQLITGAYADPGLRHSGFTIIPADIHCALAMDGNGRVFFARQTR